MIVNAGRSKVTVIPATVEQPRPGDNRDRKLKVAAYCRVSSEKDEQLNSFEVQVSYYTEKITNNPNWKMAGIYADEGITGTSLKKRDDFKRMIRACRDGRIDLILVKSVSRFGRNTIDNIKTARSLKERGIGIYFEEQAMNTLTMDSEMLLAFFSAHSQAESENIRANVNWGNQRAFQQGKVRVPPVILGFCRGPDGNVMIDEAQSKTVQLIFDQFLAGKSCSGIKKELEKREIKTAKGGAVWHTGAIQRILQNEKYKGDALLQKTYRPSLFSERVENNGALPKYYVSDCLPQIITPEKFYLVQEELRKRSARRSASEKVKNPLEGKYSGKYALSSLLICGECGTPYRRVTWTNRGTRKVVWRCISRLDHGKKLCAESPSIEEGILHVAIMDAIRDRYINKDQALDVTMNSLSRLLSPSAVDDEYAIRSRMQELKEQKEDLVKRCLEEGDVETYELLFLNIRNEMEALEARLSQVEAVSQQATVAGSRIDEIGAILARFRDETLDFNDGVVYQLIREIRVYKDRQLEIFFVDGTRTMAAVPSKN